MSYLSVIILLLHIPITDIALEPPPYWELPAVMTWYDPSIGGINCDDDCNHVADGTLITEDLYGQIAACDRRLLGHNVTIEGVGTFRCRDTGGMIRPMWSQYYQRWVLYFDIMLHESPEYNYWLFEEWSAN
jgi:hypothetical protein